MESKVGLSPDLNPDYTELKRGFEALVRRWQELNININTYRVPYCPLMGEKAKQGKLFAPFSKLQYATNVWLSRAENFLRKHPPQFLPDQDPILNVLWCQNELNTWINSLQVYKFISHYAIGHHREALEQKRNFQIAISAFLISMASLVATLFR